MTHKPTQGPQSTGPVQGDPVTGMAGLMGLIFGGISVGFAFESSMLAGVANIVALVVIGVVAFDALSKGGTSLGARVFLGLAALWTLLAGSIAFNWHWLAFTPTLWVTNALFVAALAAGIWNKLSAWAKALAALFAAALAVTAYAVPRPPGGEGPLDTAEKWKIDVEVTESANGSPLEGARVLCATVMQWETTLGLDNAAARVSDREGRTETWEFEEDPRLKVAICNAWKDADDGNAGYPLASQIVPVLAGGGSYKLSFALAENAHPDTAFLAFVLSGNYAQAWYYLDFEVWDGAPQSALRDSIGPQPLAAKSWGQMPGHAITLSREVAARDLFVRYHYEGPAGPGGRIVSETESVNVGPIDLGTRKQVALTIPHEQ